MYKFRIYPLLLACIWFVGCSSETVEPDKGIPPVEPEVPIAISFSSRLELEPTKSTSKAEDLREKVNVTIRAYSQNEIGVPTVAARATRDYLVQADGSLTAKEAGEVMYLGAGSYTFYALSVNAAGGEADSLPPALADGSLSETTTLRNQTDYLYCAQQQAILSRPEGTQEIALSFTRLAARLQITIVSEGGDDKITAAEAPSIKLPLTDPSGSKITLGATPPVEQGTPVTGEADYTTLQSKGDYTTGYTAGAILLPMQAGKELPVSIVFPSITFNGLAAQTNKLYTLTITTPEGGFVSGNQYNYKVNITGNQVGFTTLSVNPWTGVNGLLPDKDVTEDQEGTK